MDRPLICIDIESTGTNPATDRIIELAIVGETRRHLWQIRPGIPIPPEATGVHGISNLEVANWLPFSNFAEEIHAVVRDSDIIGFNCSNFDVPILWEELYRAGIEWDISKLRMFDAGTLFKKREQRTLEAAVRFYCGMEHDGAHNAMSDAIATLNVWNEQMRRYGLAAASRDQLAKESAYEEVRVDLAGKIVVGKDGRPVYAFGKSKGNRVIDDPGYARWMLNSDFPEQTKMILRGILEPQRQPEMALQCADDDIPF